MLLAVPSGEDCDRARDVFPGAAEVSCVPDEPFSSAERRWLRDGPRICWQRERYILQIRLVRRCGEMLRARLRRGARYRWLLRARADARWERFPTVEELAAGGVFVISGEEVPRHRRPSLISAQLWRAVGQAAGINRQYGFIWGH